MRSFLIYLQLFALSVIALWSDPVKSEVVSYDAIHYAIQKLPVAAADRQDSYKHEQLRTVSRAIEKATQAVRWPDDHRIDLAAYLISIGYHESRYSIRIHEGVLRAHSYGIFQITPHSWKVKRTDLIGLTQKETDSAAFVAATALSKSWNCGSSPADHFTAYYGGVPCKTKWRTLDQRVSTYWYIRSILVKKQKEINEQNYNDS